MPGEFDSICPVRNSSCFSTRKKQNMLPENSLMCLGSSWRVFDEASLVFLSLNFYLGHFSSVPPKKKTETGHL